MKRLLAFLDCMASFDGSEKKQILDQFDASMKALIEMDIINPIKGAIGSNQGDPVKLQNQLNKFQHELTNYDFKNYLLKMVSARSMGGQLEKSEQLQMMEEVGLALYTEYREPILKSTGMRKNPIEPSWSSFISVIGVYLKNKMIDWKRKNLSWARGKDYEGEKVINKPFGLGKKGIPLSVVMEDDVETDVAEREAPIDPLGLYQTLSLDMRQALKNKDRKTNKYFNMFEKINDKASGLGFIQPGKKAPSGIFSKAFRSLAMDNDRSMENFGMNKDEAAKTYEEMLKILHGFFMQQRNKYSEVEESFDAIKRIISSDQREAAMRYRIAMWITEGYSRDCIADRIVDSFLLKFRQSI